MTDVVIFRKADPIPDPIWRTQPSKRSLAAVTARLGPEAAGAVARARIEWRPAAEVLREANRSPLPLDDPDVARHIGKVRAGKPFAPVVVDGAQLVDGEHRLTVAHAHGPQTKVPVLQLKGTDMAKKSKTKKSATRPRDVDSWREYSSPSDAIDEAVRGAYDRPDEEELNAEAAEIKRQNPGLSGFAAHMEAARRRGSGATVSKSVVRAAEDPVGQLGASLSQMHAEARRADMTPGQRQILNKAASGAQTQYLKAVRPWAVEGEIAKADAGGDALVAKAERIRQADPSVSRFAALRQAANGRRA